MKKKNWFAFAVGDLQVDETRYARNEVYVCTSPTSNDLYFV